MLRCRSKQEQDGDFLTELEMKKSKKPLPPLEKGQLWKTDSGYIQIWHIGQRLIDYKMMEEPGKRAATARQQQMSGQQSSTRGRIRTREQHLDPNPRREVDPISISTPSTGEAKMCLLPEIWLHYTVTGKTMRDPKRAF